MSNSRLQAFYDEFSAQLKQQKEKSNTEEE